MWPCSDKLECIKLEEEKTSKQTSLEHAQKCGLFSMDFMEK